MGVYQEKKKFHVTSPDTLLAKYMSVYHKSNHLPVCVERLIGTSCMSVLVLFSLCLFVVIAQTIWVKWGKISSVYNICVYTHTERDTWRERNRHTLDNVDNRNSLVCMYKWEKKTCIETTFAVSHESFSFPIPLCSPHKFFRLFTAFHLIAPIHCAQIHTCTQTLTSCMCVTK